MRRVVIGRYFSKKGMLRHREVGCHLPLNRPIKLRQHQLVLADMFQHIEGTDHMDLFLKRNSARRLIWKDNSVPGRRWAAKCRPPGADLSLPCNLSDGKFALTAERTKPVPQPTSRKLFAPEK